MNLTSVSDVRAIVAELGLAPRRALGQNFLVDGNILRILLGLASLKDDDIVLEVGPGLGALTRELVGVAGKVVAVEKDRILFDYLRSWAISVRNLDLMCGDFLALDAGHLAGQPGYKVVSNLPYSSASRILVQLARSPRPPSLIVATIQKEVADRLVASSGGRDYGMLGVWLRLFYRVETVRTVSAKCFWPRPEVESTIVCMSRLPHERLSATETEIYLSVTKYAFGQRRKQLAGLLGRAPGRIRTEPDRTRRILAAAGLSPRARPEDLPVQTWCELARYLGSGRAGNGGRRPTARAVDREKAKNLDM